MANNQNFRVEMFKQNNLRSPNEFKSGSDFLTYFNTLSYDHKFYIFLKFTMNYNFPSHGNIRFIKFNV